jgi:hypothetical protein
MKRSIWVVVLLVAACGPKTKFPSDDRADREVIDCPTGPALNRAATAAWELGESTESPELTVTCKGLFSHEPLWLIYGVAYVGDEVVEGAALTTPGNELRWNQNRRTDDTGHRARMHNGFTTADLDGDAHDELLEFDGAVNEVGIEKWVVPYAITAGKAVAGPKLPISSAATGCDGEIEIVGAPRGRSLVQITEGNSCAKPGVHVYGWDGQQLVEE